VQPKQPRVGFKAPDMLIAPCDNVSALRRVDQADPYGATRHEGLGQTVPPMLGPRPRAALPGKPYSCRSSE